MSISAMKQALELIEKQNEGSSFWLVPGSNLNTVVSALRQAIEEKHEPVAWVYPEALEAFRQGKPWTAYGRDGNGPHTDGVERTPLYIAPVHASDIPQERVDETAKGKHEWGLVTDDALIEEVRRRGFTIRDAQISPKIKDEYELCCQKYDTRTEPCTPRGRHLAKREWVGLTDQEIYDIREDHTYNDEEFNEWGFAKDIEAKLREKNCG